MTDGWRTRDGDGAEEEEDEEKAPAEADASQQRQRRRRRARDSFRRDVGFGARGGGREAFAGAAGRGRRGRGALAADEEEEEYEYDEAAASRGGAFGAARYRADRQRRFRATPSDAAVAVDTPAKQRELVAATDALLKRDGAEAERQVRQHNATFHDILQRDITASERNFRRWRRLVAPCSDRVSAAAAVAAFTGRGGDQMDFGVGVPDALRRREQQQQQQRAGDDDGDGDGGDESGREQRFSRHHWLMSYARETVSAPHVLRSPTQVAQALQALEQSIACAEQRYERVTQLEEQKQQQQKQQSSSSSSSS